MVNVRMRKIAMAYKPFSVTRDFIITMEPRYDEEVYSYRAGFLEQGKRILTENAVYHHHYKGEVTYTSDAQTVLLPYPDVSRDEFWAGFSPQPVLYLCDSNRAPITQCGNILIPWGGSYYDHWTPAGFGGFSVGWGGVQGGYCTVTCCWNNINAFHWNEDFSGYRSIYWTESYDIGLPRLEEILKSLLSQGWDKPEISVNYFAAVSPIVDVDLHSQYVPQLSVPPRNVGLPKIRDLQAEWDLIFRSAVNSASLLDINSISYLRDIVKWRSILPPIRDLRRLRKDPKAWANLYLYLRYGLTLTVRDTKEVIEKFILPLRDLSKAPRKTYNRVRYRLTKTLVDKATSLSWRVSMSGRVIYDPWPGELRAGWDNVEALRSLDLFPTAENLWDLIPYSFVLDWFIPISDWLQRIDTELRVWSYNIYCVTMTTKFEREVLLPYLPGYNKSGSITEIYYQRDVTTSLPFLPTSWVDTEKTGSPQRALDAAALMVQRTG